MSELKTIYLHGMLGRKYGKVFHMDVRTAAEAVRALCCQLKGFRTEFAQGKYRIVWKTTRRIYLSLEATRLELSGGEIHIVPLLAGASSKSTGIFLTIAGATLIATAFILAPEVAVPLANAGAVNWSATAVSLGSLGGITYGNIATLGFGLLLLGASTLLAPIAQDPNAASDGRGLFTSPIATSKQGVAVPIIYGRWFHQAPIVISSSISNVNVIPGSV